MKAVLIYRTKVSVTVKGGKRIVVAMDLHKVPVATPGYPDGYKFGWIAFDPEDPMNRVLFDSHPPKGPHLHIDQDETGIPYEWKGLEEAQRFFEEKIKERFGDFVEEGE